MRLCDDVGYFKIVNFRSNTEAKLSNCFEGWLKAESDFEFELLRKPEVFAESNWIEIFALTLVFEADSFSCLLIQEIEV